MPQDDERLRPFRLFRTAAVRWSLLLTIVMAVAAHVVVDASAHFTRGGLGDGFGGLRPERRFSHRPEPGKECIGDGDSDETAPVNGRFDSDSIRLACEQSVRQ